jgi:septum site-determining protein MinC
MPVSPAGSPAHSINVSFEIKSAHLPLVALMLKTTDWDLLKLELEKNFGPQGESPDFFDHDALVIDFSQLDSQVPLQDIVPLLKTLRTCNLVPVAVRGASALWVQAALQVGLVEAPADVRRTAPSAPPAPQKISDQRQENKVEAIAPATMVIDKPLRSGQKVYAQGTDLVLLAMVNQGAEVVADGNIHVYAPLRGRAMAGARGNTQARIFALSMEPELISIAGVYRTSENPLSDEVRGRAAQVRLSDDGQEKLLFEALKA